MRSGDKRGQEVIQVSYMLGDVFEPCSGSDEVMSSQGMSSMGTWYLFPSLVMIFMITPLKVIQVL